MVRRDAQVGQYAVDTVDASAAQCAAHEAEVGLDEREALVVGGVDARVGILIERIEPSPRRQFGQYAARVTAAAEREIDVYAVGTYRELLDSLFQQNGYVVCFGHSASFLR